MDHYMNTAHLGKSSSVKMLHEVIIMDSSLDTLSCLITRSQDNLCSIEQFYNECKWLFDVCDNSIIVWYQPNAFWLNLSICVWCHVYETRSTCSWVLTCLTHELLMLMSFWQTFTHSLLLSFSPSLSSTPHCRPCPRGAKHSNSMSPGSNLLTLQAQDSSKERGRGRKCFLLFIQTLCPNGVF